MLPYLTAVLGGCVPHYGAMTPIEPGDLWSPLPIQHVTVRDLDIAYVDSGGQGEPIVFVHGLSSYIGFWEYQLPHFAEHHRVLALDLPGYGASSRPDAPYTPPWYAEVVADWMTAVNVPRATLVGHSMGAQIVLTLALEHPERVSRLVLSAPAGLESFSAGAAAWTRDYWNESRALRASEEDVRANFTSYVFNRTDEGVERLIEERVRVGKSAAFAGTSVAVSRSIAGMLNFPVRARLGDISVPTLIVFGTRDKMIPNPIFTGGSTRSIGEIGRSQVPGARLVMIPNAGHTVHHDSPETFNAALDEFIP